MFRTENALILREVRYKESDRILTVLTADAGKLTLSAHGALSKKSRIAAATQQLTYAELTLFEKNGPPGTGKLHLRMPGAVRGGRTA